MIHLRKFSTIFSKSALETYKCPLSRSKLLGVLIKAECTSSVPQLIRFLNVEDSPRVPNTNADDTNKEVTKILSEFSVSAEDVGRDTRMRKLRGVDQYEDGDVTLKSRTNMSIEDLRKFIKEADTQKLSSAMAVIHNLCSVFKSKFFPQNSIKKYKDVESLISPNELKDVLETIERDLRFISDLSLLKVLDACTILNISDNSSLMQKLFKLLSSNINSMTSINVLYMYCILKTHYSNSNKQVAALTVACNEFFKNCFESNLHPQTKATTMAYYVSLTYIPLNVKECLIRNIFESRSDLPFWTYSYILKGLLLPEAFAYTKFHRECIDYIIREAPNRLEGRYSPISLYFFLKSYSMGAVQGVIPYNESFLDIMALKIVKLEPSLSNAIESCRQFFQMSHFNYALFEYVGSKAGNALTSEEYKTLRDIDFYFLTKVLSGAGKLHTKIMNNFFREKLEAACSFYPKFELFNKIELPLNLAILGIYDDRLLERCFTSEKGGELTEQDLKELNKSKQNHLLLLHQAVTTFHPSYQKPLLSEELMKKLASNQFIVSPTHNLWQEVVESCFGGPNFVMKNCTSPLHHNLSYVVVLDKNNVPIDVASIQGTNSQANHQPFNIADISTSEERQVIVIQDVWSESQVVFRNVSSWKGKFQLYIDVLEVYCNGVIPLLISEFKSLSSFERVPFLLSKIEKKFGVIGKPMSAESEK